MERRDELTADGKPGATSAAARLALGLGLAMLAAAGVALWSSEGAAVFASQAFAALIACF